MFDYEECKLFLMSNLSLTILLVQLLEFLANIAKYSDVNMMTPANLGIVFSPNILQTPDEADVFRQFEVRKIGVEEKR